MKILFLNLSTLKFNVATPENEPLGGSESCVAYLAGQLAQNGHDVTLLARLPDGFSGTVHNVRHQPVGIIKDQAFFEHEKFDVIVACNAPVACPHLREASPASFIVLWDHVPPDQPSMRELANPDVLKSINCIAYVSEWQRGVTEQHFGINKKSCVIGNGLTPAFENLFSSAKELLQIKQNRAAYTTIPYRGLPVLLEAMKGIPDDTKLDIFSSMRVYQMADDEYAALYEQARADPRITYHGSVSQKELALKLKPAAFLAYPCIVEETFCISALEAMAAGMKVIATQTGALATTTMGYADLIPIETRDAHQLASSYVTAMERNIAAFKAAPEAWAERMFEQIRTVNKNCTWRVRVKEWEKLFAAGTGAAS